MHTPPRNTATAAAMIVISVVLATLLPAVALACPSCYGASSPRVITSYLWSAAIMSLLPFTMVGIGVGIALYLRRQTAQMQMHAEGIPSPARTLEPIA